jgi:glycosyltransferase involved in cell wall biosynthesis
MSYFPKYFPAGAEIQAYFIARHMVSRGWSVHFTAEDCGQATSKLQNEDGIWVHKLKWTRLFNPVRCWSFYRELIRINADVYYQRGGSEYTFVTWLASRSLGKKFVWGTSSALDCEGKKYRRSLTEERITGVKRLILLPGAWVRDALISAGRKRADVIVVQDERQHAAMEKKFGEESMVIKTGHPLPQNVGKKVQPPLMVWIANVKGVKRPELFVELARACRDLPARFLLVGGRTTPFYRRQVMKRAQGLDNLEVRWTLPFPDTNELLAEASLLVNTSVREGFPNTFVQAWLRETPVVSLAVDPGGVLRRHGMGTCSGSFRQMVQDVRRLLRDKSLREEMGIRARAYAVTEHNLADKLERYARLFEALCNESGVVQPARFRLAV